MNIREWENYSFYPLKQNNPNLHISCKCDDSDEHNAWLGPNIMNNLSGPGLGSLEWYPLCNCNQCQGFCLGDPNGYRPWNENTIPREAN